MTSGIYCFENKVNGKKYIGQAVDLDRRLYEHRYYMSLGKDKATALQRAVSKYGLDSFDVYVLEYCKTSELNDREVFYIKHFQSTNRKYGYNISSGGNSGMLGYKHPKEVGEKISKAKKGWVMGEAQREFISKLHTGKLVSKSTRKKISDANTGENHPMYGKKHTEETKQKMKESHTGEVAYQFGKKSNNSSSKFYGVSRLISKGHTYWVAYVKVAGIKNYLGASKIEIDAAKMYDAFVIENELPNPLNFPEGD